MRAKASAIDRRIGAVLEERRIARAFSPGDMARRLGVSRQQYKKYEGGTDRMSASKLQLALEALAVPTTDFFERVAAVDPASPRNAAWLRQTRDLVKAFRSIGERAIRHQCLNMLRTLARQREPGSSEKEKRG
ncbi:MAG: helix-turn-helix transcriptional regulator [Alphaproteobacteria bacterium]|nr:helix-turn-helix transcriptional regulator [Alphaproteobacteria bacterium]